MLHDEDDDDVQERAFGSARRCSARYKADDQSGRFTYDTLVRLLFVAFGDLPWMTVTSGKSCDWFSACLL